MFLKVSKTPHTVRCSKGQERKSLRIGTKYSFALVESCRNGKKTGHKTIANLGSTTVDEYEPLYRSGGVTSFGTSCITAYVKSFNLDDPASFRKTQPDPPIRFYHTFTKKLIEATSTHDIPAGKIKEITNKVMQLVPIYSIEDYRAYMRSAVMDRIRQEASGGYGKDLGKMIGQQTSFDAYDYVSVKDGLLQRYSNVLKVEVSYDFQLM